MLGYLANTLIFILVGVVIAQQAFFGIEGLGWMYLVVVYLTLTVVRWAWCLMLTHPPTQHSATQIGLRVHFHQVILFSFKTS